MKRIIICADDYGQNKSISQAIIHLLEKKRLTATSCMTTAAEWPTYAKALHPFCGIADIGLHFNLTEGNALSSKYFPKPLAQMIVLSQLRLLKKNLIVNELHAQLDCFQQALGRLPNFIDGHQHVHQFPIVRDALLEVYEKRLRQHPIYLRCTYNSWFVRDVKQMIINFCGAYHFKKILLRHQIPHNSSFAGIYDFKKSYAALFPNFLQEISHQGLIMCHPAQQETSDDKITLARINEYQYFLSDKFLDDLQNNEIQLDI